MRGASTAEGRGIGGGSPACTSAARKAGTPSPRSQTLPWSGGVRDTMTVSRLRMSYVLTTAKSAV